MSVLSITKAKFKRTMFAADYLTIIQMEISKYDAIELQNLIEQTENLKRHLNISTKPNKKIICNIKYGGEINFAIDTQLDFDVVKIEYSHKYNNFTYVIDNYRPTPLNFLERAEEVLKNYFFTAKPELDKHKNIYYYLTDKLLFKPNEVDALLRYFAPTSIDFFDELFKDNKSINKLNELKFVKELTEQDRDKLYNACLLSWKESRYHFDMFDKCFNAFGLKPSVIYNAMRLFKKATYDNLLKPYHMVVYSDPITKEFRPVLSWDDVKTMKKPSGIVMDKKSKISAGLRLAYFKVANQTGSTIIPVDDLLDCAYKDFFYRQYPKSELKEYFNSFSIDEITAETRPRAFILSEDKNFVSYYGDYSLEKKVSKFIHQYLFVDKNSKPLFDEEFLLEYKEVLDKTPLDDSQKDAVLMALRRRIFILTGGPGTGKSTVLYWINHAYKLKNYKRCYASPTAKAAERIFESTGEQAQTLHRLFKIRPDIENTNIPIPLQNKFILDTDVLVIDEASMLSSELMLKSFDKLDINNTALILVGDPNQLKPIERGCFFADLIDSGRIPLARLMVNHRINAGSVAAKNALNILQGVPCDLNPSEDFEFIEANNDLDIQNEVLRIQEELKLANVDVMDIQTITPQNTTCVGVEELNQAIKPIFNPTTIENHLEYAKDFDIGDKVTQTINNPDLDTFNGAVGKVVGLSEEENEFKEKAICVKFGEKEETKGSKTIFYPKENLKELSLAYALTVHKSQGSDYPYVIMVLSDSHHSMLKKDMLYTAVTRVKNKIFIIGNSKYLLDPSSLPIEIPRHTQLKRMIKELPDIQLNEELEIIL